MESIIDQYLTPWTPTFSPTTTSISSINPTNTVGLQLTFWELQEEIKTQTNTISLYFLSRHARAAAASYTLLSNQLLLALATAATAVTAAKTAVIEAEAPTTTASIDLAQITQEMLNATLCLKDLEWKANLYAIHLSVPFNALFAVLFLFILLFNINVGLVWGKTKYFSICLILGSLLEVIGYSARTAAHYNWSDPNLFLCQIITLTIAPAFIMAGVYYLLSQLVVIHGPQFSILRPRHISYIFIFCDVMSLLIQAAGGGTAAMALRLFEDTKLGTYIMVGGIAFQVLSMTIFLWFLFDFIYRINFKFGTMRFSIPNFWHIFFNTSHGKRLRETHNLESLYEPQHLDIRARTFFNYMPLAIVLASAFVYTRCIYQVIELSEGWRGYLITHEPFILALDALMIFLGCLVFTFLHPSIVFGRNAAKTLSIGKCYIKHNNCNDYYYKNRNSSSSSNSSNNDEIENNSYNIDKMKVFEQCTGDNATLDNEKQQQGNTYLHDKYNSYASTTSELTKNSVSSNQRQSPSTYSNPYLTPTRFEKYQSFRVPND